MYSKGDTMEHWDEAEYNYFMSLDDMTKVYYLHDYLYGEFEEFEEWEDGDMEDSTLDEDVFDFIPEETPKHRPIEVLIDSENFIITCDNKKLIKNTVGLFMMDGFLMTKQSERGDTHIYKIISIGSPLSVN